MGFVTNQKDIVKCARNCYINYPTIVNNIPKDKNNYDNILSDYANVDNKLSKAQEAIGVSSNLAQLAQTYNYTFKEQKYQDYTCILSVLAQVAIDSAKRAFDVDVNKEISLIQKDMGVKENKYPIFWKNIQDKKLRKQNKELFSNENINKDLICPMNYLCNVSFKRFRNNSKTLPMSYFFNKYELDNDRRKCKKVEELIEKYSLDLLYDCWLNDNEVYSDFGRIGDTMLISNYDDLINDIKRIYISNNYLGLISWLIDRSFLITRQVSNNKSKLDAKTNINKSILLKVLYDINPNAILKIFSKNCKK